MTLLLAAAVTLTPVQAHTSAEIEDWLTDWKAELALQDHRAVWLGADLADFAGRHGWYFWPEPDPAPTKRTNRGMGSNVEQWRPLVEAYFGDIPGAVDICLCLMGYESGGNPNAYNPSGASGLMQVLSGWADNFGYTPADLFIPEVNLAIARALYNDGGWKHWSPWNRGACH
jgi:hypothetical protein